jgi:hypothetical protein
MLRLFLPLLGLAILTLTSSCQKEPIATDLDYQIEIIQPQDDHVHVGEKTSPSRSYSGKHRVSPFIMPGSGWSKKDGTQVLFDGPSPTFVNSQSGRYTFSEEVIMNVPKFSYWVLEASVWGEGEGPEVVRETMEFFVH